MKEILIDCTGVILAERKHSTERLFNTKRVKYLWE